MKGWEWGKERETKKREGKKEMKGWERGKERERERENERETLDVPAFSIPKIGKKRRFARLYFTLQQNPALRRQTNRFIFTK